MAVEYFNMYINTRLRQPNKICNSKGQHRMASKVENCVYIRLSSWACKSCIETILTFCMSSGEYSDLSKFWTWVCASIILVLHIGGKTTFIITTRRNYLSCRTIYPIFFFIFSDADLYFNWKACSNEWENMQNGESITIRITG